MTVGAATSRGRVEALLVAGGSVFGVGVSGLASIVIARELGVAGRGTSAAVLALAVLCGTAVTLGLPVGAGYAIAPHRGAERAALARAGLVIGIVLAAVGAAVCLALELLVRPGDASTAVLATATALTATLVVAQVVQQLLLTGAGVGWYTAMQALPPLLLLSVIAVLALLGDVTVLAVVVVSAGGTAVATALGLVGLRRRAVLCPAPGWERPWAAARRLRPFLAFSLMVFATTALTQIVQRLDVLLVDGFRGSRAAGLYTIAVQLSDLLLVVPAALGALVFRRGARGETGHWEDLRRTVRWTLAASVGAAAVFASAGPLLIRLLVGTEYEGAALALRLLLPGAVLLGVQSVISHYVAARGHAKAVLVAWLTGAGAGVTAHVIVIPEWGIEGAAVVSSLSYALVLGLHVGALRQVHRADLA